MTFKARYFFVALASLTLCVTGCNPAPAAPTVDSIAVKENTATTEFFVGDQFSVGGGKLVVTYSNQTTEEVSMTLDMIKNAPDMSSEHLNYTVNVEYEKKATSYVVNVRNPSVTSIAIKQSAQPLKKFLMGDEFTVAGGKLIVNYNNNSTQEIDMTLAMIKNAPTMNEPHANYEVQVEYGGAQTTYNVDVDQAFVLDSSNRVEEENYTKMNAPVVKTVSNVKINNYLAKGAEGKYAKLASTGRIYNYSSDGNSKIPGMSAMKVTFTGGKLYLQVSRDLAGKIFTDKAEIPSGQLLDLSSMQANYFILSAGDAEVDIEKIQLVASGTERNILTVNQLGQEYTGAKGDIIYKTVIEGDDATLVTLNKEQNDSYTAKVSVEGEQVKFTIANTGDLYFTVNEGRTKLTVDATKGIGAGFSGLAFNEVFTVEDFEEYEDTGAGYDDVTKSYAAMTGLRAEYHADFNNSETTRTTSLLGWKLMGSGDYLTLSKNGGRNQSKAGVFKVSNESGLRYVSMSSLYNVPKTLGKGSTFSFWAHGAVKADGTAATTSTTIKIRVFYSNPVTSSNLGSSTTAEYTIPAGADWTEYKLALDSSKEYYGFFIYSTSKSQYLPVDDIKIYTDSPYAEYVAPPKLEVALDRENIKVAKTRTTALKAIVTPDDTENKNVTWKSSDTNIAIVDENGVITPVATGTVKVTATSVAEPTVSAETNVTVTELFPGGLYVGYAKLLGSDTPIVIGLSDTGDYTIKFANTVDAQPTSFDLNRNTGVMTFETTGKYTHEGTDYTFGTITAAYDPSTHSIKNLNVAGTIGAAISNNGSIECAAPATSNNCDGSTEELQNFFVRRSGDPWTATDNVSSNSVIYQSGGKALEMEGNKSARISLALKSGLPGVTLKNVGFWVYNPSNSDITLRQWIYKSANFGGAEEIGSVTAKAGQWTLCLMGFGSKTIYNVQVADFAKTGVNLIFDNFTLYA